MTSAGADASAKGWKARLRESLNDDLVEVRCAPNLGGFDFLIVHVPGKRREALERFLDALRGPDMPGFDVHIFESGAAPDSVGLPLYVSV